MKNREWEVLKKAEKNIFKVLENISQRQDILNQFLIDRLTIVDYKDLEIKLKEFDESQKPENKEKERKEVMDQMLKIGKARKPNPKKEV